MPIDFPNPPLTIGQQYQYNGTTWQWNGSAWIVVGTYPPIGGYVTTYNGLTGAVQGVSAAVAGSGVSVSGATGTVTITNTGVTGIQAGSGISVSSTTGNPTITNSGVTGIIGGTGIFVSSATGYPTIGVTLASNQSFIGSDVPISNSFTTITGLTLAVGTWFVTGNATFIRGTGTQARSFAIQITDGSTTYASGTHGMGAVVGQGVQLSVNSIITLGSSTNISLKGYTSVVGSPSDYAAALEFNNGVSNATGLLAFRIA